MRRKPRFLNSLERRRLRRLGLLPTKKPKEPSRIINLPPDGIIGKIMIKDERKGTEELLKEEEQ